MNDRAVTTQAKPRAVELWQRVAGGSGAFTWAVWREDGTLGGDVSWFTTEDAARDRFEELRSE